MKMHDYMELLRRLIFYLFIILYLIICPLVVLYAFGFIYNPLRKDVEESGLVHIKTLPVNATVYLEKSRYKHKTPTTIYSLLPGKYKISLFLEDYHPWKKYIAIEPGKALDLNKIILLPYKFEITKIAEKPVFDILPVEGTDSLLVLAEEKLGQIKVLSLEDYQSQDLVKDNKTTRNAPVEHIYTADNSNKILAKIKEAGKTGYLVIDVTDNSKIKDITNLITSEPVYISWSDQVPDYIFTFRKDYVDMIDITKEGIYPQYLKELKGFGLFEESIYILDKNNTIAKLDYDKPEAKEFLKDKNLEEKIFRRSKSGYFRMDVLTDKIIAFLGNEHDLILNIPPYSVPDEKILGVKYFPDSSELLMWTKQKVGIITFVAGQEDENGSLTGFEYSWIYESGAGIKQCFFVYDGSHILLLDGNKVLLLSLRLRAAYEIVTVKRNTRIFYSESGGALYFIDSDTGYLSAITLLTEEPAPENNIKNTPQKK